MADQMFIRTNKTIIFVERLCLKVKQRWKLSNHCNLHQLTPCHHHHDLWDHGDHDNRANHDDRTNHDDLANHDNRGDHDDRANHDNRGDRLIEVEVETEGPSLCGTEGREGDAETVPEHDDDHDGDRDDRDDYDYDNYDRADGDDHDDHDDHIHNSIFMIYEKIRFRTGQRGGF